MDIDKIVIGKIYNLMEAKGWSQRELAKQAKINYENFNRLMKGGRSIIKSDVLPDIAKALGVTAEFLKSVDQGPPVKSDRSDLILHIQSRLTSLNEKQLGFVDGFIDDLLAHTPTASGLKKSARND